MQKLRVILLIGINDTNEVEVRFRSLNSSRALYNYTGNVEILPLFSADQFEVFVLVCGGMPGDPVDVPPSDVLFNAICNPDTNKKSLAAASDAIHGRS